MGRRLIGVLVALGLLLVFATPASAEHRKFRVGVTDGPESAGTDLPGMGRSNVETLRVNFSWLRIETMRASPGSRCGPNWEATWNAVYDWDEYDHIVRRAGLNGVRLLPVIVGSPSYVAQEGTHAPLTSRPEEIGAYKCFVRHLVDRYGRGGKFQTLEPVARPITEWQVWNEPNLAQFSTEDRGVDPREYARLVSITRNQVRLEDRRAKIVLAGLPQLRRGFTVDTYLRQFYAVRGIERRFDAVALHPYSRNVRGVRGGLLRLRSLLRDLGDANRYVWITEVGWATQGRKIPWLVKSPRGQARQLRKTFSMLRENRRRFKVGTAVWFRWRDTATRAENMGTFEYAGLYKKGGAPKPSCYRFVRFTNGACSRIP